MTKRRYTVPLHRAPLNPAAKARYDACTQATRTRVLEAALVLAEAEGFQCITRRGVAELADVALGSVSRAFGTMIDLKRAVLMAAVERQIVSIVAQGLADGHPIARDAPPDLRQRAIAHVTA